MPFPENEGWMPVNGMRAHGRGGILGFAATLARPVGASCTSPILRGHWISETLLGETLPPPPANVPELPENEDTASMSIRALTQAHTVRTHAVPDVISASTLWHGAGGF